MSVCLIKFLRPVRLWHKNVRENVQPRVNSTWGGSGDARLLSYLPPADREKLSFVAFVKSSITTLISPLRAIGRRLNLPSVQKSQIGLLGKDDFFSQFFLQFCEGARPVLLILPNLALSLSLFLSRLVRDLIINFARLYAVSRLGGTDRAVDRRSDDRAISAKRGICQCESIAL